MNKIRKVLMLVLVLIMLLPSAVAAAPYETYTYTPEGEILKSPDTYVPDRIIDADYIGLDVPIDDPRDLFVAPDERVYVVDAANNRVVVTDKYYRLDYIIDEFVNEHGVPDTFSTPSGVFVNDEYVYVCDTDNSRIVMFDTEGNYVKIIDRPESSLFEEGSLYKPIACAVDEYGRIFVISSTTYEGVIVINDKAEFSGFIGAQKVSLSPLEILWRRFQSEEQRAQSAQNISTEFNNITIDSQNFIYVTTSSIKDEDLMAAITGKDMTSKFSPVKKLNASGSDVMRRNGDYPPSGEIRINQSLTAKVKGPSKIVDAGIGPLGTWSIIDERRQKVYTYDENGNLLFAFGDSGTQTGNIASLAAVAYQGTNLILLDKANDNFVIYRRTEYGDLLMQAIENDVNRKYDLATTDWTEILKRNNNYSIAYLQLGKASFRNGEYEEAMNYYETINNTVDYADAFREVRTEWANKYFWVIPIVIVAVFVFIVKFLGYATKVNKRAALKIGRKSLKEELLYAFHVIFHPFDGFWDLKHEKRGSIKSAFVILLLTIVAFFYRAVGTGYMYSGSNNTEYLTIVGNIFAVLVPLLLWAVANWCLTTLFEGEGSLKDIFIASCYALTPLPILMIPSTLLSNVLVGDEEMIMTFLSGLAFVWMGILLFFAMMITHDYTLFKNILTSIGTVIGMAIIMFIGILFTTLMSQIVGFISNIAIEITYRM